MTAQQKQLKVFLLGDSCIDEYVYVEKKQNPESSADLLAIIHAPVRKLGMAENVAVCLEKLGVSVTPCMPTASQDLSVKSRYIDATGNTIVRIDQDRRPGTQPRLVRTIDLNTYDAVVISDYNKGWVTDSTIRYVIDHFKGPIFLDTKKKNLQDFAGCIMKINSTEFISADYVDEYMYITFGAQGAVHKGKEYDAYAVDCIDPCGAGDAFLAGLVYGVLMEGLRPAIHYAIVCGGIATTALGTYSPSLPQLYQGLQEYDAQQRQG